MIDRLRLEGTLDDDDVAGARTQLTRIERTITMIVLSRPVLDRAALPMATVIKTLDAIHLASAMLCRERQRIALAFATHDPQQARAGARPRLRLRRRLTVSRPASADALPQRAQLAAAGIAGVVDGTRVLRPSTPAAAPAPAQGGRHPA